MPQGPENGGKQTAVRVNKNGLPATNENARADSDGAAAGSEGAVG